MRLLFEIEKRGTVSFADFNSLSKEKSFDKVKSVLLSLRYPESYPETSTDGFYLPKVSIDAGCRAKIGRFKFYPENIFIEQKAAQTPLAEKICSVFSKAKQTIIPSVKLFTKDYQFKLSDYNKRTQNLFLAEEKYDYCKPCPCTAGALRCGYSIFNLGFGCPFECSYCFLQGYQNFPGIIIPVNLGSFLERIDSSCSGSAVFPYPRFGSGEFTDSLVFDDLTGFSKEIIHFFSSLPDKYFEFKTKSINVANILSCPPQKNIVVSWSLNPQKVIDNNEFYTASLDERISAAKQCSDAGFGVGFHFDPIIYYDSWEKDYFEVIEKIFSNISQDKICWISLGTLRMPKNLKKAVENRFPENKILDGELLLDQGDKLRYLISTRIAIYSKMVEKIRGLSKKPIVYLCMEPKEIWQKCGLLS